MDDRIAKALDARLTMEVDDDTQSALNARVIALEQHVQSLATHQQQLEGKIDESHKQTDARISTLQTQVGHELEKQSGQMQELFATQLRQIESLLAKGGRHEWMVGQASSIRGGGRFLCGFGTLFAMGLFTWGILVTLEQVSVWGRGAFLSFCDVTHYDARH